MGDLHMSFKNKIVDMLSKKEKKKSRYTSVLEIFGLTIDFEYQGIYIE